MPFFIIFLLIPLVEIAVFIHIGGAIGIGTTLFLALLTALIGGGIIRYQGLQTLSQARGAMEGGALPAKEIFDGFCLVAAGATLITPGFVTDTIGFLLLVPTLRDMLRSQLGRYFTVQGQGHGAGFSSHTQRADPDVIEAEYEEIDERDNRS